MYDNDENYDNNIWNDSDELWCPCCGPDYTCNNCGQGLMIGSVFYKENMSGPFCEECAKI